MTTVWTDIPKPSVASSYIVVSQAGVPMGLLLALTYATTSSVMGSSTWIDIPKATSAVWTDIPKAT